MNQKKLSEVCEIQMGQSPPSSYYNKSNIGLPFLQGNAEFGISYPLPVKWCSHPVRVAQANDVLISVRAPIGDVNIANQHYCIGRGLAALKAKGDHRYLFYYLKFKKDHLTSLGTGTTFQSINRNVLENLLIPLPASVELQTRIVDKIDTLFAEIDAGLAELQEAKEKLGLYKQSILNAAIRGKLVSQDENDEPAEVLLKKIKAEKEILIKSGKIKKEKPLPPIDLNNVPFELPKGWVWSCFAEMGIVNPKNNIIDDERVFFLPMTIIPKDMVDISKHETRDWKSVKKGFTHLAKNDIVLAKITPCFENGKSAVLSSLDYQYGAGTTELHVFRDITGQLDHNYLLFFIKRHFYILVGKQVMTGSAGQKRVPTDYFAFTPIPLPPLAEQRRIVQKAMLVLNDIQEKIMLLSNSIRQGEGLKQSILKQAFEGKLL